MSALENIRKRSTILLAIVGLAMLAFILGDLMQSKRSGGDYFIAEVAGEKISVQHFDSRLQETVENWKTQNKDVVLTQSTMTQIRNSVFEENVRELIMNNEYDELGVAVESDEMFDLFQGNNVHAEVLKIPAFQDPNTKQFDRARILQYMKNLENDETGESKKQWYDFETYIKNLRTQDKYANLVKKGMYITMAEAQANFNQNNENISIEFVSIPYTSITDSLVQVSDKEMEKYYKENIHKFQQEDSRNIEFVVFPVVPTNTDIEHTKNGITELVEFFKTSDDDETFIKRNSDNTDNNFSFVKQEGITDANALELFSAIEGTVVGPYNIAEHTYRIAKLSKVQNRPDSVEARHILISPSAELTLDSARGKVEAFKSAIQKGADFGEIAKRESQDKGSGIKGGDLGWFQEGAMVPEFNEVCFTTSVGELTIVETQFGIHLIEVTKMSKSVKKVKIAYVDRIVEPSTNTYRDVYAKAAHFATTIQNNTSNFEKLVESENLVKRNQEKVAADAPNISGLEDSRSVVRWMNGADLGDVSDVFELGKNYVVASLTKINEKGNIPIEDIKEQLTALVRNQKKGEEITKNIQSTGFSSLTDLATKMSVQVQTTNQINFANNQIQNIGNGEYELLGTICAMPSGAMTPIVFGNNAVFVAKVLSKSEEKKEGEFSQQQQQIYNNIIRFAPGAAYNTLKEAAGVVDNRNQYY